MYAIAVIAILSLLVGFLAGRAVGIREGTRQVASSTATDGQATPGTTPATLSTEGQVQQPSGPPPAVGEGKPAGGPPTSPASPSPAVTPAPAPAAPATGRLTVNSTPRGAGVSIDKQWRGRTPLTLTDLPLGRHEVRVVQDGYAVSRQEVTLSSGTPNRTLSIQLKRDARKPAGNAATTRKPSPAKPAAPQSFVGEIYVDSRPRGARVFLDGKMVGVTPIRIPDVTIGSHVIRLQLDAHRDFTTSTRVVAGEERRVTGSLDPIR